MIVARSFSPPRSELSEKHALLKRGTRHSSKSRSRSPLHPDQRAASVPNKEVLEPRSEPVKIPSRSSRRGQPQSSTRPAPVAVQPVHSRDRQPQIPRFKKESAQTLLSATTIPARRRIRGRVSQRIPDCDHVADFSKLLLDDIQHTRDGSLPRNHSSSHVDGLFGHIDGLVEGQMIVGSEGADESVFSTRSISSESLASLASPDDFSAGTVESHRSSIARSYQGRSTPKISASEDCADNHPLAQFDNIDDFSLDIPDSNTTTPLSPPSRSETPLQKDSKTKISRSTFKSTLTSSLKALKSAARTTFSSSSFGLHGASSTGFYTNESFLAHNFFDIQPSLTDDKRPPPALEPPSPELRRYLNPGMATGPADSPTQLHFWQDERYAYDPKQAAVAAAAAAQHSKSKSKTKSKRKHSTGPRSKIDSLPPIVPLSTCLPPTVRTANASSPPIWLTPDGEPVNKNTSNALLFDPDASTTTANGVPRAREPRENRDFLRIFVCEMAMRRSGKLNDDLSAGRARLWLPPVPSFQNGQTSASSTGTGADGSGSTHGRKTGAERWKSWGPNDLGHDAEVNDDVNEE